MRKISLALCAFVLLSACSDGFKYTVATYKDVEGKDYAILGETWRIFDKPDAGKMMITSSIENAAKAGAQRGLTYGLARKRWTTDPEFRPAATAYISQKGCQITSGRLLVWTQFEYDYTC